MQSSIENVWPILSNIIYKIHSIDDIPKMQKNFLESIRLIIPYNISTFYLADYSGNHVFRDPVGINISFEKLQNYIDFYEDIDYLKWVYTCNESQIYRQTDLFPDSVREQMPYYQIVYQPEDIHYAAMLTIVYSGIFLGIISLYRPKNWEDFSEKDLLILKQFNDHLALRLYRDYSKDIYNGRIQSEALDLNAFTEQSKLTQRESEIFKLLVDGLSNEEISQNLFICSNTLKKHVVNIYRKIGVKNRLQLIRIVKESTENK